jgi:hypothetical protein
MITEMPHMSQDFPDFRESISIISFRCFVSFSSVFRFMWGTVPFDVGQHSGM